MILPPPISTLFPYTTLFRSVAGLDVIGLEEIEHRRGFERRLREVRVGVIHRPTAGVGESMQRANRVRGADERLADRKSTRLNSSHRTISYAVFCLKKKNSTR